jgi:hypothetical protein
MASSRFEEIPASPFSSYHDENQEGGGLRPIPWISQTTVAVLRWLVYSGAAPCQGRRQAVVIYALGMLEDRARFQLLTDGV